MTASPNCPTSISSSQPNHAPPSFYPQQEVKNRTLRFQSKWYTAFPWLHYEAGINGVLCFYCSRAGPQPIVKNAEPAFSELGFHQWNRANESFDKHQASRAHKEALAQWLQQKKPLVTQLSVHHASNQCGIRQPWLWLCQYGNGRRYDCGRWVEGVASPLHFPIFLIAASGAAMHLDRVSINYLLSK